MLYEVITGLTRDKLVAFLEAKGIQTRMLFAGNLIKHPCFDEMRANGSGFRVIHNSAVKKSNNSAPLPVTDRIMRDTFRNNFV